VALPFLVPIALPFSGSPALLVNEDSARAQAPQNSGEPKGVLRFNPPFSPRVRESPFSMPITTPVRRRKPDRLAVWRAVLGDKSAVLRDHRFPQADRPLSDCWSVQPPLQLPNLDRGPLAESGPESLGPTGPVDVTAGGDVLD
jgi:hypothetical protein